MTEAFLRPPLPGKRFRRVQAGAVELHHPLPTVDQHPLRLVAGRAEGGGGRNMVLPCRLARCVSCPSQLSLALFRTCYTMPPVPPVIVLTLIHDVDEY